ncbi:hypothetical protein OSTOST_05488 [Ostertagia ostertagi]
MVSNGSLTVPSEGKEESIQLLIVEAVLLFLFKILQISPAVIEPCQSTNCSLFLSTVAIIPDLSIHNFQKRYLMVSNGSLTVPSEGKEESIQLLIVEAVLLFLVSVIGMAFNVLAFSVMIRHQTFNNSFGRLAACYALANALFLTICAFWATPWTIW